MRNFVKASFVAVVLLGSTLSAFAGVAGVTGSDPRPAAVTSNGVTGSDPRPAVTQPVSVWNVVLTFFGVSSL